MRKAKTTIEEELAFLDAVHLAQKQGRLMPFCGGDCRMDQLAQYAGVIFANRLEVAWARYFDELELPWRYEQSGDPADFYVGDFLRTYTWTFGLEADNATTRHPSRASWRPKWRAWLWSMDGLAWGRRISSIMTAR